MMMKCCWCDLQEKRKMFDAGGKPHDDLMAYFFQPRRASQVAGHVQGQPFGATG